jgi:Protein of unknown function (DUF1573)
MLRWIVLAVVVVALTGLATFLSVNAPADYAKVAPAPIVTKGPHPIVEVVEPLIHEFGTMAQLTTGTHTWEFKNQGDADLELWFESSTCSCTVAKLKNGDEKKTLVVKPKDSTTIDLEWQTKTFHDEYSKGATIGTNDPNRPAVSISVHGKVHPPIMMLPGESITFNTIANDELHYAKIAIFSKDHPDFKITKLLTSRPEFLVAKPEPLTEDQAKQINVKAGYQIVLELKAGMPIGRFQDELLIETNHPLKSEVKATITGNVTGPISVIPERLRMPSVSGREGATREMTIQVRGGKPTKFTVASHPEKVQVDIKPDDTPTQKGRYKLTVTVPKGTAPGPVESEIILKTDHPAAAEIKIPVTILIGNSETG